MSTKLWRSSQNNTMLQADLCLSKSVIYLHFNTAEIDATFRNVVFVIVCVSVCMKLICCCQYCSLEGLRRFLASSQISNINCSFAVIYLEVVIVSRLDALFEHYSFSSDSITVSPSLLNLTFRPESENEDWEPAMKCDFG